ncbi:hypothetical protein EV199_0447 [Pseudobacter ginsenosidimutans]|uniref:Uncharacterized protein n=1 Tax=Pseudobacter ginsenosidimutans TaxID=661488 RepID=A0A4Q7N360_9BACT|nr:hypothetical protein EV199_0447 [Pseudobacter ginsenosidimutans]
MIRTIIQYFTTFFLLVTIVVTGMRLLYLHFRFNWLSKLKFIQNGPDKLEMTLVYSLVLGVAIYSVYQKLCSF